VVAQPGRDEATDPIRLCITRPSPGIPTLPAVRALGLCGGLAALSTTERLTLGAVTALVGGAIDLVKDPYGADVLMHPHDALLHPATVSASISVARRVGRQIALFSSSDEVRPSPDDWGVMWRTSGFASRIRRHERVAAGEVPDLVTEALGPQVDARPWSNRPSVGFMGHVAPNLASIGYLRHGWQHWYGFTLRERVLRTFERSSEIEPRFVRRSRNLGPPGLGIDVDGERLRMRQEYVQSVFDSDYSLCVRGAGNWSYRFFEALSAGRIPVLIDTDSVLPETSATEWEHHVCRISVGSLQDAPRTLSEFHARIGPSGFRKMQLDNRELWVKRLAPAPFFLIALRQTIACARS
jgi:hypothetical protein